jgi:hypothetical protein
MNADPQPAQDQPGDQPGHPARGARVTGRQNRAIPGRYGWTGRNPLRPIRPDVACPSSGRPSPVAWLVTLPSVGFRAMLLPCSASGADAPGAVGPPHRPGPTPCGRCAAGLRPAPGGPCSAGSRRPAKVAVSPHQDVGRRWVTSLKYHRDRSVLRGWRRPGRAWRRQSVGRGRDVGGPPPEGPPAPPGLRPGRAAWPGRWGPALGLRTCARVAGTRKAGPASARSLAGGPAGRVPIVLGPAGVPRGGRGPAGRDRSTIVLTTGTGGGGGRCPPSGPSSGDRGLVGLGGGG